MTDQRVEPRADEREKVARMVRELRGLVGRYTIGQENALRVINLLHEDIWRITDEWAVSDER